MLEAESKVDRFQIYQMLLLPLEKVKESPQVPSRGRRAVPQPAGVRAGPRRAALRRGVPAGGPAARRGQGDRPARTTCAAALEALDGFITPRTAWLIEHHMEAHAARDGKLGARARRRLEAEEDYEELMLLARCDRAGRQSGVEAPDLDEALDYLRDLAQMCEG